MKSTKENILFRLAELILINDNKSIDFDSLYEDVIIGPTIRDIQIESPYQELLKNGVISQFIIDKNIHVTFTVEEYYHYILAKSIIFNDLSFDHIINKEYNPKVILFLLKESNKNIQKKIIQEFNDKGVPYSFIIAKALADFIYEDNFDLIDTLFDDFTIFDLLTSIYILDILKYNAELTSLNIYNEVKNYEYDQNGNIVYDASEIKKIMLSEIYKLKSNSSDKLIKKIQSINLNFNTIIPKSPEEVLIYRLFNYIFHKELFYDKVNKIEDIVEIFFILKTNKLVFKSNYFLELNIFHLVNEDKIIKAINKQFILGKEDLNLIYDALKEISKKNFNLSCEIYEKIIKILINNFKLNINKTILTLESFAEIFFSESYFLVA